MKKKILATAAVLSLTLLAGCGAQTGSKTDGTSVSGNSVEQTVETTKAEEKTAQAAAESVLSYPITIEHRLGTTVIEKEIERIAVFDLAMLDVLHNLGLGDKVIGLPKDSVLPEYLEEYKDDKYINLGSLKELDMEAIYASKPDLIMIAGRQTDYYEQLGAIAPVVSTSMDYTVPYMESVKENLSVVGTLFEKQAEIDEYLDGFTKRLEAVNALVTKEGYTAVVSMVSDRSMKALGENSRCSLISKEAGFKNLGLELNDSTHGDSINYEYLLEKNPDFLFVLDRNAAIGATEAPAVKEVVENELVKQTKAYENNRIIYLSPAPWYLAEGGISSTDSMIGEIEGALGIMQQK